VERHLFLWILIGLLLGLLAKTLLPGREPGGFVLALLLGIAGALGGGILLYASVRPAPGSTLSIGAAMLGALGLLLGYRVVIGNRMR